MQTPERPLLPCMLREEGGETPAIQLCRAQRLPRRMRSYVIVIVIVISIAAGRPRVPRGRFAPRLRGRQWLRQWRSKVKV